MSDAGPRSSPPRPRRPRILVAGLGNEILTDDGVGIHVCRLLAPRVKAARLKGVLVAEVGTAPLDAAHLFRWADRLLAIDAMQAGGAPGTIYLASADELAHEAPRLGLHELALLGVLQMMALEDEGAARHGADGSAPPTRPARRSRPSDLRILGVEPAVIGFGLGLSAPLAAVASAVAEQAWALVTAWHAQPVLG